MFVYENGRIIGIKCCNILIYIKMLPKIGLYILICFLFFVIIFLSVLTIFQEQLIYPGINRPTLLLNEPFENIHGSYYKQGTSGILWVIFGGNHSLPADFIHLVEQDSVNHSFLIITYPGYNETPLKPTPESINLLVDKCIQKIMKNYKINFLCYSIGCAAGINYLHHNYRHGNRLKLPINKLILLAPFWSLDEIVHSKYPFPKSMIKQLLNHNWENEKLKSIDPDIKVIIIHGKNDELIHFSHSERLAKLRHCQFILTNDTHGSVTSKMSSIINEQSE